MSANRRSGIFLIAALGLLLGLLAVAVPAFAASKEKVLYSFCATQLCPDGSNPVAGLIPDAAGNLYGTAVYGGNSNCPHGCGTVFELMQVKGKWKLKVLHHFEDNGEDGYYPEASLIFDAAGNLYGTTSSGGTYQSGTVFELMPRKNGKWIERTLYSFDWKTEDGTDPISALTLDSSGNLYGTTFSGGNYNDGIVFKLSRHANGRWIEKVLYDFDWNNGKNGCDPQTKVIFDVAGNLYGTTSFGGPYGSGDIFELIPSKHGFWTEKMLYNFTGGSDGSLPTADLVFDAAGNLYSTTLWGGSHECRDGCGTAFKLTPDAKGQWTLTTLYSFDERDGAFPNGVIFDAAGNLYGATRDGGAYSGGGCDYWGCGTVFKLTPGSGGTWSETVLHSFNDNGVDGYQPYGSLVMDRNGNLYGTTYAGGAYNYGTVFEVTP